VNASAGCERSITGEDLIDELDRLGAVRGYRGVLPTVTVSHRAHPSVLVLVGLLVLAGGAALLTTIGPSTSHLLICSRSPHSDSAPAG
jgi:hypothetical protein